MQYFYPRPPGGGRPSHTADNGTSHGISIHALRVEGDRVHQGALHSAFHFYPRPPGGGRHTVCKFIGITLLFLSTPSGWRATLTMIITALLLMNFYPRPPGGGRRQVTGVDNIGVIFLSTPSGWRATVNPPAWGHASGISIHALRVEGDDPPFTACVAKRNFYPRPPGGGRLARSRRASIGNRISIHALRVEGDHL